jgi:parvulin-like peptidyl-prolyl isomerase
LRKESEDAAFALKPTNLTEVIDVPENFFIARVTGHRPAAITPFAESRKLIDDKLIAQARSEVLKKGLAALRAKCVIRIAPAASSDARENSQEK